MLISVWTLFGHLSCVSSIAWKDLPSKNFDFWRAWEKSNIRRNIRSYHVRSPKKWHFSSLSKNEKRPQKQIKSEAYYWLKTKYTEGRRNTLAGLWWLNMLLSTHCFVLAPHWLRIICGKMLISVWTRTWENYSRARTKNISQLTLYSFPSESISLHSVLYIPSFSHVHM